MDTTRPIAVVGVFEDSLNAQHALQELQTAGFLEEDIGMIAHSRGHETEGTSGETNVSEKAVGTGAVTGSLVGAGAGGLWALGIAAGILPGIGPVIAGGILASILASAALGAATGGVAGALIGLGVPEEEANYYESEFKAGHTVVTVRTTTRFDEARRILREAGAYDIETRPALHTTGV